MRLVKIKNKYLFKSDNPNGYHGYVIYWDKTSKSYRGIQLTHLYNKDVDRFDEVKRGNILVEKFKEYTLPSGVRNQYYDSNVFGSKIDIKHKDVISVSKRYLNPKQSKRIINFAKKKHR